MLFLRYSPSVIWHAIYAQKHIYILISVGQLITNTHYSFTINTSKSSNTYYTIYISFISFDLQIDASTQDMFFKVDV